VTAFARGPLGGLETLDWEITFWIFPRDFNR